VLALLVTLPAFITIAAWIAAIGVVFSESGDGQQMTLLITMPLYLPFMLLEYLIAQPSSPAALMLSFFPLTAALTLLIRMGAQNVPTWQLVASIALQSVLAAGSLWAASRVFHWGMLRPGAQLSVRKILARLRKPQ
jgi:ABC-2 type transport system permease protein